MKPLCLIAFCILVGTSHAQWKTETYDLKGGWNAIYLHGDATHATPDQHFASGDAANILEIWRWNTNPNQVQFTTSPQIPSAGTPEWTVWKRDGSVSDLTNLSANSAYLVKCLGSATDSYQVTIPQRPVPPATTWVRAGANLLGFPSFKNTTNFPLFSDYFATFPAAIAPNSKIFKYTGGDFGPANPIQVFSPGQEQVDRNQAYWFESAVISNFYAPLEISLSNPGGFDFGRTGSVITARIRNRTAATVTVTITPTSSDSPPASQPAIEGDVPLTLRTPEAGTGQIIATPITTPVQQVVGPGATVNLSFGIDRPAMTGASDAFYASLLRFNDSDDLIDICIPARASVTSLAGLWIGDAEVSAVESKVPTSPGETTPRPFPLRLLTHVADDGTARLLSQVFLGTLDDEPNGHPTGLCTKEAGLKQDQKANALRLGVAHMPLDQVITAGSGSVALGSTLVRTINIPWNDPTNPFVHQYHPDHDNRDARPDGTNVPLGDGVESHSVSRTCTFEVTAAPPGGTGVLGWGNTVIGGNYTEVLSGLHKQSITVSGTFTLRRVSEIGAITIN